MKRTNRHIRVLSIMLCLVMVLTSPLTASAADTYTLTYYANNGTGEAKTDNGSSITLADNSFTYGRCEFAGWNTQPDGSGYSYSVGDAFTLTEDTALYAQWELRLNESDAFTLDEYAWTGKDTSPYTFTMKSGTKLYARVVFPNVSQDDEAIIAVDGDCEIIGKVAFESYYGTILTIQGEGTLKLLEKENGASGDTLNIKTDVTIVKDLGMGSSGGADSKIVIDNATLTLEGRLILLQYLEMTNAVFSIGKTATFIPISDPDNSAYPDKNIKLDEYSEINIQGTPEDKLCTKCIGICVQGYSGCDHCLGGECNWYDEADGAYRCNPSTVAMGASYIRWHWDSVKEELVQEHVRDAFDRLVEENYLPVGYKFTGDDTTYYPLDGEGNHVTGSVRIRKHFTLTYDAGLGTGTMSGESSIYAGDTYTLPANGFTAPTDCVFAGWSVGGKTYTAGDEITIVGDTVVKALWAEVAPSYTVTIPATVELGKTATIEADDVVIEKGTQVEVSLTGTSEDDNTFKLKTQEGAELLYTVQNAGTDVKVGDTVLTVNPEAAASGSTTLSFIAPTSIQYAGTYTGTVTFTVSVDAAS